MMPVFVFQRGETIVLALDAVSGDPQTVDAITAHLKALPPGRTVVPALAQVAASFTISSRAATGEIPAGWTLTIPAATSAGLPAGAYVADARIEVGGGVVMTDSVAIRLREAVTS
jgi:hypothetical protein